jgi:DNA-binding NtrC family response regulator
MSSLKIMFDAEANMGERPRVGGRPRDDATHEPRGRLLVVEDDYDLRRLTRFLLTHLGYHVVVACDAKSAMQVVAEAEKPFDLLLCDVILPFGIGGAALAEELSRLHPKLKTIFMSGYPEQTIKADGNVPDDATVIMKPFRQAQLETLLRQTLKLNGTPDRHGDEGSR